MDTRFQTHRFPVPAQSLARRASEDVRFIRSTMERAVAFTAVPGWGGVLMGVVGGVAAVIASRTASPGTWVATWISAAVLAVLIGVSDMAQKARLGRGSLLHGAGWRFAMSFAGPFLAAACITFSSIAQSKPELLPQVWLLMYGTGVVAAGAYSIPKVRWMGVAFLALGVVAMSAPATWGNALLGAGFGGLHVAFGLWIVGSHRG